MLDRDDRLLLLGSLVPARGLIDAVKDELASFMPRTSALLAEVARDLDGFATEFVGGPEPELWERVRDKCVRAIETGVGADFYDDEALWVLLTAERAQLEDPDDELAAKIVAAARKDLDRHVIDGPTLRALKHAGREVLETPAAQRHPDFTYGEIDRLLSVSEHPVFHHRQETASA